MLENEILDNLNNWDKLDKICIEILKDQDSSKELKFIAESRRYSDHGILTGPITIECAKKCLEIGLDPIDFSFETGNDGFYFFHYGFGTTLKQLNRIHEYYEQVKSLLKQLNISEKEFNKWNIENMGPLLLTKNKQELDILEKQLIELKENGQFDSKLNKSFSDKEDWIYFK